MNEDDNCDAEDVPDSYILGPHDKQLLDAAKSLLTKVAYAPSLHPAQLVSVAKLQHALARLPHANSELEVQVSVVGPRHTFGEVETYHYWDVTLECGTIRLASGGHFYRSSSGGDSFNTVTWEAEPGQEADLSDYSADLWMVPDLRTYADGVASVEFNTGGYSIEVTDSDNPLLEEMEDEEEVDEEEVDEDDDCGDDKEATTDRIEFTVAPVDASEAAIAKKINKAEVDSHEPDYAYGATSCDFCQCQLNTRGLYVDGMASEGMMWANMCVPCFNVRGAGLGWGKGQLYARQSNGDWRMVAGFRPAEGPQTF
jgi:hypothetical protein